jgi:hypothetical protein
MGRPKVHATAAARQAAYRQRRDAELVSVNRTSLAAWETRLTRLLAAIAQAAHAGDPLARRLQRTNEADTLDNLTAWFTGRGKEGTTPED